MGGPYNIPRNYKGENKILFIFSMKSFLTTVAGAFIGGIFLFIFNSVLRISYIGIILFLLCALIGFVIGSFNVPELGKFELTKKTGGEPILDVIIRWFKFKQKKKRIYIYKEGVHSDGK